MRGRRSVLLSLVVLAVLSGQAAGSEPDLLQQNRRRQEIADVKAIGATFVAITQAVLVRPWYPPLADRILASAQVNIFTDLDASCECRQQLFRSLGWFLRR